MEQKRSSDEGKKIKDEVCEIAFSQEEVAYYVVDEQDNEIGVCLIEDGKEVEYYYADCAQDLSHAQDLDAQTSESISSDAAFEIDISEYDVSAYLYDENNNEIGFCVYENDVETEYYYADEQASVAHGSLSAMKSESGFVASSHVGEDADPLISAQDVKETSNDLNAIYKDGAEIASELKGAYDDIASALNFSDIFTKVK